jgi:hypothetical protein
MASRRFLAGCVALAGCAHAYASPTVARTSAAPGVVFDCVKQQIGVLGYKQNSIDTDALRVNATKLDLVTRRSDTQFRRILNKLQVDVNAESDGQTSLKVVPQTFGEYTTQRGPTEVEEKPSKDVTADGQRLMEACQSTS